MYLKVWIGTLYKQMHAQRSPYYKRYIARYLLYPDKPCQCKRQSAQKQWKNKRSNCDRRSQLEPYKTSGFLTSGRGSACEMLVGSNPPMVDPLKTSIWLMVGAFHARAVPEGIMGDPSECAKMLYMLWEKTPENG